jgi:hypothetical protein
MYCACHGICTLSLLGAAIPMRFGNNTQHPKTLRLPGTTTMNLSQVLPLPLKKMFQRQRKQVLRSSHKSIRQV